MTFWEHLDELRGSLIRMAVAVVVCAIVAFLFKEELFGIILAPQDEGFITYRLLDKISQSLMPSAALTMEGLDVQLINTGLANQFLLHVTLSANEENLAVRLALLQYIGYGNCRVDMTGSTAAGKNHVHRITSCFFI